MQELSLRLRPLDRKSAMLPNHIEGHTVCPRLKRHTTTDISGGHGHTVFFFNRKAPMLGWKSRRTEAILSSARKAYIRESRRTIMKLIEMTQVSDELAEMVALLPGRTAFI